MMGTWKKNRPQTKVKSRVGKERGLVRNANRTLLSTPVFGEVGKMKGSEAGRPRNRGKEKGE